MKVSLFRILAAALLLCSSSVIAQVSVNPLTGAANVVIPVYPVQRGSINFPINLVYSGSGIRPLDAEGTAGIGWQLQVGGQISRQVRGLPDDIHMDNLNYSRKGWIYNSNQTKIGSFSIANTGVANCTNESSDITYINSHLADTSDTEPDMFYVNAPGLSCQMFYNKATLKFQPITYQDLVITYTLAVDSSINSFTIVNDAGTKYMFGLADTSYKRNIASGAVNFNINEYNLYKHGITYKNNWYLTSITDASNSIVSLRYTTAPSRGGSDTLKLYVGGSTTATIPFITSTSETAKMIATVNVAGDEDIVNSGLTFTWATNTSTGQSYYTGVSGRNRNLVFNYSGVAYGSFSKMFLRSFTESGCSSPINYKFTYAGEYGSGFNSTLLPDSANTSQDWWGYYSTKATTGSLLGSMYANPANSAFQRYHNHVTASNGGYNYSFSGADRSVDPTGIVYGSLIQMSNVNGGTTTITYEPNDYSDPTSGTVDQGGGIRVKQIVDYDGLSTAHNVTRNYAYINPATGTSSGKPVTLPQFAFSMPYNGTATGINLWIASTAISAYDLSMEDHTVMYGYVRESKTGAGSTLYQYYIPATNFDTNASPDCSGCTTEWTPTVNLVARPTCASYGIIASSSASYPFISNPNYDFERGMPQKTTTYNDGGTEVSEVNYTYQRWAAPLMVTAFKFEDVTNSSLTVRSYNKYPIYYNTGELTTQQTSKVFDSKNLTQSRLTTVNYTYGSTYHKLLTQQVVNSDASIVTTTYSYIKDYAVIAGTNLNVTAIAKLQQQNINAPVEAYTTVKRGAGAALTTQASLTLFSRFITPADTVYRPSQLLVLDEPEGASFAPLTITGQTLTRDPNYNPTANFLDYDSEGVLQSSNDGNNNSSCQFYDHLTNQTVAIFKNAAAGEVFFEDYDSDMFIADNNYTETGTLTSATDRNGKYARTLTTGQSINYNMTKNAKANNYIFSCWINATTGGTITLTLTPTGGTAIPYNVTYTLPTGWQYFEWPKMSVTGITSTFALKITTSAAMSIDDILFYPEIAEVSTAAYDLMSGNKLSGTNTNGISEYYKYDTWGRLLYAYDQDHNILKKNSYVTPQDAQSFGSGTIYGNTGSFTTNTTVNLSTTQPNACVAANTTYKWDFGDGTNATTSVYSAPAHVYHQPGTYTITLTINSSLFGQMQSTASITVTAGANTDLSYSNNTTSHGNISTVSFYNGTTLVASFTAAQLPTAQILKGSYTMKIVMAAGASQYNPPGTLTGYGGIAETGDGGVNTCQSYSSTNSYSFPINLSTCNSLNIAVDQINPCQ